MIDDNENVFISYVREDRAKVDRLVGELRREGVHVWLDRDDIEPGSYWADALRNAIKNGAYFLACFSNTYHERARTYMNEELEIACQQAISRPDGSCRIIPIRFSQCEVPALRLPTGRTLQEVQWIDLSESWNSEIWKLLQVVRPFASTDKGTDQFLWKLCDLHIRSIISRAQTMGATRVRDLEEGWKSLLLPSRWQPTISTILRLLKLAVSRQEPVTERWIEQRERGIHILITFAPTPSPRAIFESLPTTRTGNSGRYNEFIQTQRQMMRRLPDWPRRDMAHWIFCLDDETITADLMYWPSVELYLDITSYLLKSGNHNSGTSLNIESAIPGSLLTAAEFDGLHNDLMCEEVRILQELQNANNKDSVEQGGERT